jgi:hypothetical protein
MPKQMTHGLASEPRERIQREKPTMRRQSICCDSPVDALVAVAKRLARHEAAAGIESEEFFARYTRGEAGDDASAIDRANDYRHFPGAACRIGRPSA